MYKDLNQSIMKPCIRQCCLNEEDICLGCFRTFDDMLQWNKVNTEEKMKMLKMAEQRRKEHTPKFCSSKKSF